MATPRLQINPHEVPVPSTVGASINNAITDDAFLELSASSGESKTRQDYADKANSFHCEKDLRSELVKARRYRGRLRGQLRNLHEQMDTLVNDDDDTRAALAELERRESNVRQALKESMMYVVELERRDVEIMGAEVRSTISDCGSAIVVRSRQGSAVASFDNKSPVIRALPVTNVAEAPQALTADQEIRPEDSASVCLHQGRSAQGQHAHATYPVEPRRQVYTSKDQEKTHQPTSAPLFMPSVGRQYHPFCDGGTIGKLTVVHLKESFRVAQHCRHLEELLCESGAGEFAFAPDGSKSFQPFRHLRHACVQKLLSTLEKCPDVLEQAQSAYNTYGDEWSRICESCTEKFARKSVLAEEMEKRMKALRFSGVREIDTYIKHCVNAFEIYRLVFPSDRSQHAHFVRTVLSRMSKPIALAVIKKCRSHGPDGAEWETCVPFHSLDGSTRLTVVEFIKEECRSHEETDRLISSPGGHRSDSVRYLDSSGGHSSVHPREWVKKFAVVCGVTGRGCRDRNKVEKLGQADGILPRRDKFRRPYFLLGITSGVGYGTITTSPRRQVVLRFAGSTRVKTLARMNDGPCSEGSKLGHPLSIPSVENSGSPVVYSSIHLEDSISAVTFSGSSAQEVVLRVSLRFGSSQVRSIPCVVDTGAGGNYLLISKINDCEGWGITEIPPISVSLADGSVSQIRYGIRCSIAVQDCDGVVITDYKECTLRCLLCSSLSSEDEWRVLAGRDLVNLWGLVLYGTRRAFIAGNCVFSATPDEAVPDGPDDMICRVIESGCTVNHTSSESGLDVPPASKSQVDR
ncbi:hypothetical protein FOL47_002177, partial [Perkinsus chesapeaki]